LQKIEKLSPKMLAEIMEGKDHTPDLFTERGEDEKYGSQPEMR